MTTNSLTNMPADYILVLNQINDNGEEEFFRLAERLDVNQSRLSHIIQSLRNKGLVSISMSIWGEILIRLSSKGQKSVNYI